MVSLDIWCCISVQKKYLLYNFAQDFCHASLLLKWALIAVPLRCTVLLTFGLPYLNICLLANANSEL